MPNNNFKISKISYPKGLSKTFKEILDTINHYLIKNKSAVSDFNLIKDIVDRKIDKEEDDIASNLPIPLYLGLIGTMLGVIIGLLGMPALSGEIVEDSTMKAVDVLLSGVKIAMIASVCGLIFTTINSLRFYAVRKETENQKNAFFSFIQTELLPILSQNTASSVITLQNNLLKFNEQFTSNMTQFDSIINTVHSTFKDQVEILRELKEMDIVSIAKYNQDVMVEIQKSFKKLKDLSTYLDGVNGFLNNTNQLNYTVNKQLEAIDSIPEIINNFNNSASNIVDGTNYLKSHFSQFEEREGVFNKKIAEFDSTIGGLLDNLKISFNERLETFNRSDVKINSSFEETFQKIQTGFSDLFIDLKEKTAQVFDDESQNIAAIKSEVGEVHKTTDQIKDIPYEVTGLSAQIKKKDETINKLIKAVSEKPIEYITPKWVIIGLISASAIVSITCILVILKLFFLDV